MRQGHEAGGPDGQRLPVQAEAQRVRSRRQRQPQLEAQGNSAAVVEYSAFTNRATSIARSADVIVAVLTPVEMRVARAVAAGWDESDVRQRIARQITDDERRAAADVSFDNDGTPDELYNRVVTWWKGYATQ